MPSPSTRRSCARPEGRVLAATLFALAGAFGCSDSDPEKPAADATAWPPEATWQWQLSGAIDTGVDAEVYDIDLVETSRPTIDALHADGRRVVCYFSAGSWEEHRPDADDFPTDALGAPLDPPFDDERWLDVRNPALHPIMEERLDLAVAKDCDAVEPDNVDGYTNDSGFALTPDDQLTYNRYLADAAHRRGLAVGLKNDSDQVDALEPMFDFAVVEQCFEFDECEAYAPFVGAGKAVFAAEYSGRPPEVCDEASRLRFSVIFKALQLDAARQACV
ncbi:MAG: endo alpha-1,4 polygalactosaminidase [Actinomycetota bacterium]